MDTIIRLLTILIPASSAITLGWLTLRGQLRQEQSSPYEALAARVTTLEDRDRAKQDAIDELHRDRTIDRDHIRQVHSWYPTAHEGRELPIRAPQWYYTTD